MKQKQIDNTLYVFSNMPYEITDIGGTVNVIYVPEDSYDAYVALNTDLELTAKNYGVIKSTHDEEWEEYINEKESASLEWSASTCTAQIGETNTYPTLSNPNSVTVTYTSSDTTKATINSSGTITLVAAGTTTISAVFAGDDDYNAQTVTYTLTVVAAKVSPDLSWSAASATAQIGETNTYPTLSNPNSVTVTYSSSDTSAATIDQSTGTIALVAAGSTNISAVFAGNSTYTAQTVTYALTVQAAVQQNTFTYDDTSFDTEGYIDSYGFTFYNGNEIVVDDSNDAADYLYNSGADSNYYWTRDNVHIDDVAYEFDEQTSIATYLIPDPNEQGNDTIIMTINYDSVNLKFEITPASYAIGHTFAARYLLAPEGQWVMDNHDDGTEPCSSAQYNIYDSSWDTSTGAAPYFVNGNVTYSITSDDDSVATVSNGTVVPSSEGDTDITASYAGGDTYYADTQTISISVVNAEPDPEEPEEEPEEEPAEEEPE